jgi:hypothetical protein
VIGALAGVGAVGLAVWLVGPGAVATVLADATPGHVAASLGLVALALLVWGTSLWLVLGTLDAGVSLPRAVVLFLGTLFLNTITPLGQAGGDPPSGLLLARGCAVRFEEGLAAVASVNTVNRLTGVGLAMLAVVTVGTARGFGPRATVAVPALVAGLLLAVLALAWQGRGWLVPRVTGALTPAARLVARPLPGVEPPSREAVRTRVAGFVMAIERIATLRTLTAVVLLGAIGQLAVAGALVMAMQAVGVGMGLAMALVAVPLARTAAAVPTPGGLGGVDIALGWLVVTLAGVPAAHATAAVVVFRMMSYWAPMVPGGLIAGAVLAGGR